MSTHQLIADASWNVVQLEAKAALLDEILACLSAPANAEHLPESMLRIRDLWISQRDALSGAMHKAQR